MPLKIPPLSSGDKQSYSKARSNFSKSRYTTKESRVLKFWFAFPGKAHFFKYNFCFLPLWKVYIVSSSKQLPEAVVGIPAQHTVLAPHGLRLKVADYLCLPWSWFREGLVLLRNQTKLTCTVILVTQKKNWAMGPAVWMGMAYTLKVSFGNSFSIITMNIISPHLSSDNIVSNSLSSYNSPFGSQVHKDDSFTI